MGHNLIIGPRLQRYLQAAEFARKNPDLLGNHFEARIPQCLTSHLADLLSIQKAEEQLRGTEVWHLLVDMDVYMADLQAEIDQVKHALTAYVPEAAGLVKAGAQ